MNLVISRVMKKTLFFVVISVLMFCFEPALSAQNKIITQPFKGFNIGFTGQMELVQKIDFVPVFGTEPQIGRTSCRERV